MTPVRHRALIFDTRLSAGNAANDVLITGSTFHFCRLTCLCVKRRNVILNGKRRSLLDSTLFHADNRTEQKTISPFSLALIFTFDFAALSERRSCPEDRSRRSRPRWCADASLRRGTYPIRTVIRFSRFRCCYKNSLAKKCALSRISKRSEKSAKQGGFPRLETERRRGTPCR